MIYIYMVVLVGIVVGVLCFYALRSIAKNQNEEIDTQRQKRYALHKQAVTELDQMLARAEIQQEHYEEELEQLNRRLVDEMDSSHAKLVPATRTQTKPKFVLVILVIPVLVAALYVVLGQPVIDPARDLRETGDVKQFLDQIQSLEQKVAADPTNLQQQLMLARSYRVMGRYADSIIAYGKSWDIIQDNASELALFAEVLALERGGFEGKPDELLAQAQSLDPSNLDVLMLVGQSALQKGNYALAIESLQPVQNALEEEGEDTQWLQLQLEAARNALAN
ncbi:c-type cytochrome biogenesis protein CcmI [Paenalcaligenes hominis]|uniref:C-type cytochrome biogenesis protein CcmI n=1 Tax=Paenalcaligenes hominis TaxID=643674 RepID=A0A1U9JYV4_9BURK|nr:c-type cytochrome biogenesis protein CcmI [Paenalcaligenes hominis]AQS50941.1 c-type cytochrome biogenesis protein CcmI [Paenalcaligenes hominis]